MSNHSEIIQVLLGCGNLDIDFIDEELAKFKVDATDAIQCVKELSPDSMDANQIIYGIYRVALYKATDEVGSLEWLIDDDDHVSIITNCLDSHMFVRDKDGNSCEMYDYDELVEFLKTNYKAEELCER